MPRRLLTPERQAELLARYPTEGNQVLAQDFGLTPAQGAHIAYENHVRKTSATLRALNTGKPADGPSVMQRVLAAVKAAGAAGMSRSQVSAALPGVRVGHAVDSLASRGHLHAAGTSGATRWFEHAVDAQAHAIACGGTGPRLSMSRRAKACRLRRAVYTPSVPATPPAAATQCPAVQGRSFEATEPSSNLFRDLGPGQYADTTPRNWVAAITRRS